VVFCCCVHRTFSGVENVSTLKEPMLVDTSAVLGPI
jgi:hypothetical protein